MTKPAVKTYHILDNSMRFVGGIRLKPGQKTVLCTEAEAKFFVENGGLSERDPKDVAAEQREQAAAEKAEAVAKAEPAPEPQPDPVPVAGEDAAAVEPAPAAPASRKGR